MAVYTVELNELVRSPNFKLFDFNYPFYAVNKNLENAQTLKEQFENNFIKHFYFREICAETPGRWKLYVENFFNVNMPYYNMLFEAALIDYNLEVNYNITEEISRNVENSGALSGNSTLTGNITTANTENGTTGTEQAQTDTVTGTTTNNSDNTQTETGSEKQVDSVKVKTNTNTEIVERDITPAQGAISTSLESYATSAKVQKNNGTDEDNFTQTDGTKTNSFIDRKTEIVNETTTSNHQQNVIASDTETTISNSQSGTQDTTNTATNSETSSGTQTENFQRKMYGDMSVRTMPEAIETHIKVQQKLTTIEKQLYAQAEELFIQIY